MASSALSPGCVLWNLLGDNEVTQRPTPERIEEIREALKGEGDFPFGVQASVARELLAEIDALKLDKIRIKDLAEEEMRHQYRQHESRIELERQDLARIEGLQKERDALEIDKAKLIEGYEGLRAECHILQAEKTERNKWIKIQAELLKESILEWKEFRQNLRQLLSNAGIPTNPCWTEADIINGFQEIVTERDALKSVAVGIESMERQLKAASVALEIKEDMLQELRNLLFKIRNMTILWPRDKAADRLREINLITMDGLAQDDDNPWIRMVAQDDEMEKKK